MSEAIASALRGLVAEIVRETLPAVLAEIAPKLAAEDDELITPDRAAEVGLTPRSLADAIRRGDVRGGVKLGRKPAAPRSEIRKWIASRAFKPRKRGSVDVAPFADAYAALVRGVTAPA